VEAIAEHLVRRPVGEANRIVSSIDSDIKQTREILNKLNGIASKINPAPTEEQVDMIMDKLSRRIKESSTGEAIKSYSSLSKKQLRYNDSSHYSSSLINEVTIVVENNAFVYIDEYNNKYAKDTETITKHVRAFVISEWTNFIRNLYCQEDIVSSHPVIQNLYSKHGEEVVVIRDRLQELLINLQSQRTKTEEIVAPINEMAKDLRAYLAVADDIRSIREATSFLGILEHRNDERGHAIAMLAHYSEVAFDALSEVKGTLDSYQSARSEIDGVTRQALISG